MTPVKRHKSACFPAPPRRQSVLKTSGHSELLRPGRQGTSLVLPHTYYQKNTYIAEPTRTQDRDGIVICVAPVLILKTKGWMSEILSSTDPLRWWLHQKEERRRSFTPPESKDSVIALVKRPKEDKNFQCSENTKGWGSWTESEA